MDDLLPYITPIFSLIVGFFLKDLHTKFNKLQDKVRSLELKVNTLEGHNRRLDELERKGIIYDSNIDDFWKSFDQRIRDIISDELIKFKQTLK
ncbi:MAG: hypothetical protein ACPGJS_05675 [Flammeovirgaceae bacterium]